MTLIEHYPTLTPELTVDPTSALAFDVYKDIHKGIRAELFAVVVSAGSIDPGEAGARADLAGQVRDVVNLLVDHAEHEDDEILPVLELHLPRLFERLAGDHEALDARVARIAERAELAVDAPAAAQRARVHNLYLDLASFTSAYLAHQEVEERLVMPAIIDVVGVDGAVAIHQAIVGSIPPPKMAESLSVMLPAMNIDDRAELLGGMREGAPAEVFASVWGLTGTVLTQRDRSVLAGRLGLS